MTYQEIVAKYTKKNYFEYNSEKLFNQVSGAMQEVGEKRTEALIKVLKENYSADAKVYEPMRMKANMEPAFYGMETREERKLYKAAEEKANSMAKPIFFLKEYIDIINAMAKDVDNKYEPEFMLGMTSDEVKGLMNTHLSSYTRFEQTEYHLKRAGWKTALEDLDDTLRPEGKKNPILNYPDGDENAQNRVKAAYVRKCIVEKELSTMNFFKKYFTGKGYNMRKYVKTAAKVLKSVNFQKEEEKKAYDSFLVAPFAHEAEFKANYAFIDVVFKDNSQFVDPFAEDDPNVSKEEDKVKVGVINEVNNIIEQNTNNEINNENVATENTISDAASSNKEKERLNLENNVFTEPNSQKAPMVSVDDHLDKKNELQK